MARTASTVWVLPVAEMQVEEFRNLSAKLDDEFCGLADRTRDIEHHRERMWFQPNDADSALLIFYLEHNEGVQIAGFPRTAEVL